jgi:hypothetical protein
MFLKLIFLIKYWHHILDFFGLFKLYLTIFRLDIINYFKISTNIEKIECMEYICEKIINLTKFENCIFTSKLGFWVDYIGEFFYGVWYWYTTIKSKTILKFKSFGWNSIQFFLLHLFSNKCIF